MNVENNITESNLHKYLKAFILQNQLTFKDIALAIGCSMHTLKRVSDQDTRPTSNLIKQCGILFALGYKKYKKLSNSEKEKISEKIGTIGGGVLGFGAISSAVSASGAVVGLSAAGITSGLAGMGALVGGGMVAGIAIVASIPMAVGGIGYGIMKGIKGIINHQKINSPEVDSKWEY